jgi:hypothetical protein
VVPGNERRTCGDANRHHPTHGRPLPYAGDSDVTIETLAVMAVSKVESDRAAGSGAALSVTLAGTALKVPAVVSDSCGYHDRKRQCLRCPGVCDHSERRGAGELCGHARVEWSVAGAVAVG